MVPTVGGLPMTRNKWTPTDQQKSSNGLNAHQEKKLTLFEPKTDTWRRKPYQYNQFIHQWFSLPVEHEQGFGILKATDE